MLEGIGPFVEANLQIGVEKDAYWQRRELHEQIHSARGGVDPAIVDSEVFLGALCDMAYLGRTPAHRQNAVDLLELIAAALGTDRQRFERARLPSCGLGGEVCLVDARDRIYTLALGSRHTPLLREEGGRMHTSAPRLLLPEERSRWRLWKLKLAQKSRAQARRLELAMLTGLRWPTEEFTRHMLPHLLLRAHIRRTLWAGYDAQGNLLQAFCVQEDGGMVSETYGLVRLGSYAAVGLPHPADVPPERAQVWAELMDAFQIEPLFLQARRPIAPAAQGDALTGAQGLRLDAPRLCRALLELGWDASPDQPVALLVLGDAEARLAIAFDRSAQVATLGPCAFTRRGRPLPLGQVPPIMLSEAMWHLEQLGQNPRLRPRA